MTAVAVVIPAHDEEALLPDCLASVAASLRQAVDRGVVGRHLVVVVAHRCTDATAEVAARILTGVPHRVVADDRADIVSQVRRTGVDMALRLLGGRTDQLWLLSTDADSVVPARWVADLMRHGRDGAAAIAGLAHIEPADLPPAARAAYRRLVRAGIHGRSHEHVYGANLAVRADAYLRAGGFPLVDVGEDSALVRVLAASGAHVIRPTDPAVTTSARLTGRARGGLADLLLDLTVAGSASGSVSGPGAGSGAGSAAGSVAGSEAASGRPVRAAEIAPGPRLPVADRARPAISVPVWSAARGIGQRG